MGRNKRGKSEKVHQDCNEVCGDQPNGKANYRGDSQRSQGTRCSALAPTLKSGLVGGNAGSPRDIEEKPWRLESLTISYLGLVDAFSFSYIDQAGKNQTAGPWGEGYSHDETKTILFGPYEFVEEVSGAYGSHFNDVLVMSLTFVTNIKTYGPFGNPYHQNVPSTPFRFRADEDSSITAFHGRSGRHRYSIGVYTCLSNKPTVTRPAPGQSLRPPIKSGLVGGSSGSPRDIEEKPWRLGSLTINYMDFLSHAFVIRFGPSESLEEVSGAYGTHFDDVLVTSLTFVTNIRTYGPFGNPNHQNVASTPFRFRANKDSSIVGFHGRSDQHIHSIGVYTA
ncbi:hypothetical protein QOZ80_8AG0617800 [Eleusine coracana subsp. coracana]|nr:hypothetical protein QOZ80_8AG0617800 [Eleusine coracana subsp. coracana]